MSQRSDWLPASREEQLAMAWDWISVAGGKAAAWEIPARVITELDELAKASRDALAEAQNETTRTPVATAKCREAFDTMTAKMRDIKRRYFLSPPLRDADYVSLGLKIPDDTPTPSGAPTAQVTVETYLVGRHELGVKIVYVTGSPDDPANKGYWIWYSLTSPGEAPPANPDALHKSFYTKRKKDVIEFGFDDSGKNAHFAVQVENDGKKGPWGPLVSALIP
jgi:hypothetical protein